ncbi:hypothetical protein C7999DRAFT_32229 [Corynascus novoguineensis]|uniref:Uncharacterized protein n=1 Tax=Corynascus novoguineensis TaxID=1126955 RepID=A0AAN7HQ47_9PEZI|nr:hypothetical protein C7999DRAFT_32229 [Corynascus novoguineensis]
MKNRRERLKQLALEHLTPAEAHELRLLSTAVLDAHAPQAVWLLHQRGVPIPAALGIGSSAKAFPVSVYGTIADPGTAQLFFRHGFRDTGFALKKYYDNGEWGLRCGMSLSYITWLHDHGVDALTFPIVTLPSGRGIFTAHTTFYSIGLAIDKVGCETMFADSFQIQWVRAALLRPDLKDDCQCACSAESCTPLKQLLRGLCHSGSWKFLELGYNRDHDVLERFLAFLELFDAHLDMRHHLAFLRFLTFQALEIPHTCCTLAPQYHRFSVEESQEMQSEHADELELLEELSRELETDMINKLQNPDREFGIIRSFWEDIWFLRMAAVRQQLDGDDLPVDQKQEAEKIGIVWDQVGEPAPPAPPVTEGLNPYHRETLDYWVYELERIEAECQ